MSEVSMTKAEQDSLTPEQVHRLIDEILKSFFLGENKQGAIDEIKALKQPDHMNYLTRKLMKNILFFLT